MVSEIWGHRGCRGKDGVPENSVPAFVEALKGGAQGIELDVWLTKDGKLVVFHDETVNRLIDCEEKLRISDFNWADLKKLRLKDHKGNVPKDRKGNPIRIPLLEEVLREIPGEINDISNETINIEIKEDKHVEEAAKAVAESVRKASQYWREDQFLVSSFDKGALVAMQKENPKIPRAVLLASKHKPWNISKEDLAKDLEEIKKLDIKPKKINITLPSLTPETVKMIKNFDKNCGVVAWTCDEENPAFSQKARQQLREHAGYADVLITDYPTEIIQMAKRAPQAKQQRSP